VEEYRRMYHTIGLSMDPRCCQSDYIPSEADRSRINEILAQETQSINRYSAEMTQLAGEKARIQQRENILKASYRSSQNTLEDVGKSTPPIPHTPAFTISQVCSRWRAIARNSPHLWSSFDIDIDIDYTEHARDFSLLLELYFVNAKDHPTTIRIVNESRSSRTEKERAIWRVLSRHIQRCRDLSLTIDGYDQIDISNPSFPNLESFREEMYASETRRKPDWFWRALGVAPKLTKVTLWDLKFGTALPYLQLRSLELCESEEGQIMALFTRLPSCENLEHLSLWGLEDDDVDIENPEDLGRVVAPRSLKRLSVYDSSHWVDQDYDTRANLLLKGVLASLSIPSLVSLDLSCVDWPPLLLAMVERSPLLEQVILTIRSPAENDASSYPVIPLMRSLPHLTHFELRFGPKPLLRQENRPLGQNVLSTVLSDLAVKPNSSALPSNLEHLSFRLSDITLDTKLVERVLGEAWNVMQSYSGSRPLKDLCVYRNYTKNSPEVKFKPEPALVEKIEELKRRFGVRLVVGECDWKNYLLRN
ncbi:hypothetical protein V5O48_016215, partial [Marasmius crinis-equi]